jgi:tetratricopeptide (TPR) repeat protein
MEQNKPSFSSESMNTQRTRAESALDQAREAVTLHFDYTRGSVLANEALTLCRLANWSDGIGRALTYRGICQKASGEYTSAISAFQSALEAYGPTAQPHSIAAVKNNLAQVYLLLFEFATAIELYEESVALSLKVGNQEGALKAQMNLANVYDWSGDFALAFEKLMVAGGWMEEWDYQGSRVNYHLGLSHLFARMNDIEAALKQSDYAFEELRKFPNKHHECNLHMNRSAILLQPAQWEDGLASAEQALRLAREMGSPWQEAQAVKNGGLFIEKLGRPVEAAVRYEQAATLFRELKSYDNEAIALRDTGTLFLAQGRSSGLGFLVRSLECAERSSVKREIANSHKSLATAYKQLGQNEKALEHHELFYEVEMKRRNEDSERQLSVMKAQQEIKRRKQDAEIQKIYAEQLERELSMSTLHLLSQTELLSNFRNELREIVRKIPSFDENVAALKEKLKELPCESIDWDRFDQQFSSTHPEFIKKLLEQHPTLTAAELRVCSLLRLNLKSEEIAKLFCLSERSVESHRFRIRKKLELPKETGLTVYLQLM